MSSKLEIEAEKEEQKIENIELEGEGIPRRFSRSEDYLKGYKAGWFAAKTNLLKKLSQSGKQIEQKPIEAKPIEKKFKKKENEEMTLWAGVVLALVLGGITLFVFFREQDRKRNQSTGQ